MECLFPYTDGKLLEHGRRETGQFFVRQDNFHDLFEEGLEFVRQDTEKVQTFHQNACDDLEFVKQQRKPAVTKEEKELCDSPWYDWQYVCQINRTG